MAITSAGMHMVTITVGSDETALPQLIHEPSDAVNEDDLLDVTEDELSDSM